MVLLECHFKGGLTAILGGYTPVSPTSQMIKCVFPKSPQCGPPVITWFMDPVNYCSSFIHLSFWTYEPTWLSRGHFAASFFSLFSIGGRSKRGLNPRWHLVWSTRLLIGEPRKTKFHLSSSCGAPKMKLYGTTVCRRLVFSI